MQERKLKIAIWNMAYWSHKKHLAEAWNYLIEDLQCDVILTQESMPDYSIINKENFIYDVIGGNRAWGSGVYCQNYKIKEYHIKTSFPGAVTAAEIEISEKVKLIFISVYGLFETIGTVNYAIPNMHRILSDLTEVLESSKSKNRIILAGDLNASIQIDESYKTKSHKILFDRIEAFNLVNCFDDYFSDYIQTHRHSRSDKPWQNDYIFLSKKLKSRLKTCVVDNSELVKRLSDHNPVIIEIEI
jgi:exonuclease III